MFGRQLEASNKSFSNGCRKVAKSASASSSFSKENGVTKRRHEARRRPHAVTASSLTEDVIMSNTSFYGNSFSPAVVTLVVGAEQRLFAAHEDLLCTSPFFSKALRGSRYAGQTTRRISLPDEEPEILSAVLEFLYKGDYSPRLIYSQRRDAWELEPAGEEDRSASESIVYHRDTDGHLLKDTVIYCAAQKYGLDELKKLALRKQGLQSGIQCSTILASARYAYANTPDNDSKLRAHYLALIIRSRGTFKRSGTMQLEMHNGGTQLFFDLFVALCNHVDDISTFQ